MKRISPFKSIWFRPSETIAHIVHENPSYRLFLLPIIAGFVILPTSALFRPVALPAETEPAFSILLTIFKSGYVADKFGIIISTMLAFAPVTELMQVLIGSYLIRLTGSFLGGKAKTTNIQAVLAWSNVPIVCLTLISFLLLIFSVTYTSITGNFLYFTQSRMTEILGWLLTFLILFLSIWSFVIFFCGLAKVQGFSRFRAIFNGLIAWIIPVAIIIAGAYTLGYSEYLPIIFLVINIKQGSFQ